MIICLMGMALAFLQKLSKICKYNYASTSFTKALSLFTSNVLSPEASFFFASSSFEPGQLRIPCLTTQPKETACCQQEIRVPRK